MISWPIAYFVTKQWLENFAYRTPIGLWVFILSGLVTFMIAFFTVSFQAVKATLENPVNCLRYE